MVKSCVLRSPSSLPQVATLPAAVAAKAEEQRQSVEAEFLKQNEAITKWADDAERDIQRVIDKADEATRALLRLGETKPAGGGTADTPPGRASGGPVAAGQAYIVGEHRPELFVPNTDGAILPYVPAGAGRGGGGVSLSLAFAPGSIVQQPGEDGAVFAQRVAGIVYERLRGGMQGRGW
jgi:hypothetical protein